MIRCREGALWITEDCSPDDITLGTGLSARLHRRGKTVVLAVIASRVEIEGLCGGRGRRFAFSSAERASRREQLAIAI